MKQLVKMFMLLVAAFTMSMSFVACSSDDDNEETDEKKVSNKDAALTAIKLYVEDVVYPTYTNLADESQKLAEELADARDKFKNNELTDNDLKAVGETFLKARAYWEASEAFLYGPATTFGIDPHIDTWPLDVEALARGLSNTQMLNKIEETGASELAPTLLGFHAIEFVLFRNGQIRTVAELSGNETDQAFANVTITGKQELIYAAAVAEDLMQKCFQLQVAWMGDKAGQERVDLVEEEWELETQIIDDYYGDNLLNAGKAGSTYKAWQDAAVAIISAGCSNICKEVANTKIGNAWTGEDPNYIESPYSKKSFLDFYDNIMSIKNSLYGGININEPAENSFMALAKKNNAELATALATKIDAALNALNECMKGPAFVDLITTNNKAAYVDNAVNAINALDDELHIAEKWVAEME
jgi:uncharacterized iron-regulated protein